MATKPSLGEKRAVEVEWVVAKGYKESCQQHKSEDLKQAMKIFNDCKRSNPPQKLPIGMQDHRQVTALFDFPPMPEISN